MSGQFKVDFSKFHPAELTLPQSFIKECKPKKSFVTEIPRGVRDIEEKRFHYIERSKNWLADVESRGKSWLRFFETLNKVISVFSIILSILFPLAAYYLPLWAPWAALPFLLLLGYGQYKLDSTIENSKLQMEFVPFLKEIAERRSFKALHPIGLWDTNQKDARLKSDAMIQKTIKKRTRVSAQWIEEAVGVKSRQKLEKSRPGHEKQDLTDVEFPYSIAQCVAAEFASQPYLATRRAALAEARAEVALACDQNADLFAKKVGEINQVIYDTPYFDLEFPSSKGSCKEHAYSTVLLYHAFCKLKGEVDTVIVEAKKLEGPSLKREKQILLAWKKRLQRAAEVKKEMKPVIKLFEKPSTAKEYMAALTYIEAHKLRYMLYNLIETTKEIRFQVKSWMANHPLNRLKAFEADFVNLKEKEYVEERRLIF